MEFIKSYTHLLGYIYLLFNLFIVILSFKLYIYLYLSDHYSLDYVHYYFESVTKILSDNINEDKSTILKIIFYSSISYCMITYVIIFFGYMFWRRKLNVFCQGIDEYEKNK